MLQNKQNFLKGINRRSSREDSTDPSSFWTLQNCRLFKRGDTGKIKRIEGFTKFNSNTIDFSKTLDILNFDNKYIVFSEDTTIANKFRIDIFDTNGTLLFSDFYESFSTEYGELVQSDETIYITPHNKILYFFEGSFRLEDYISEIPQISVASIDSSNSANGFIEPTSGVTASNGQKAQGSITVVNNNTSLGNTDVYNVEFDEVVTGDISVTYQDNENQITRKIYDKLIAETTLTNNWFFSMVKNRTGVTNTTSTKVYITSKTEGSADNGIEIHIIGSDFNIDSEAQPLKDDGSRIADFDGNTFQPNSNTTILTSKTTGGQDPQADFGPLFIRFNRPAFTAQTDNIVDTDTTTSLANKIENALNSNIDSSDNYSIGRVGNRVNITSIVGGKKENTGINIFFKNPNLLDSSVAFTSNKENLTGGTDSNENITLEKETDYWYKVKYRYIDGHTSYSCQPEYVFTDQANSIALTIQAPELDLDGNRPQLQVYRKKEFEDFFLIDEVDISELPLPAPDEPISFDPNTNELIYTDNGKFKIEADNLNNNIWFKSHQSSDIIDRRLVLGGINYFTEKYTHPNITTTLSDTADDKTLPQNTKARVFTRPKYRNGTQGYHTQIGEVDINTDSKKLTVNQTSLASNDDKEIDELSFYVNFLEQSEDFGYEFNSIELANQNVGTIEDRTFYPQQTRVFFGFKYLEILENKGIFNVFGWDKQRERLKHAGIDFQEITDNGPINERYPQKLTVNVMGVDFTYVRHGYANGAIESAVYKLSNFDAINKAIRTGNLFLRLNSANISGLSDEFTDNELFNEKVRVTGIEDTSLSYADLNEQTDEDNTMYGPRDTRLYLVLEESKLDTIDNQNVNNYGLKANYLENDTVVSFFAQIGLPSKENDLTGFNLSFELLNFRLKEQATFTPYTRDGAGNDGGRSITLEFGLEAFSYGGGWDYDTYQLTEIRDIEQEKSLIYLGNKDNELSSKTFEVTGYEFDDESELRFSRLAGYNIYESLIAEKDINIEKTKFPNQLVWTEQLITSNNFSGGRTIKAESFYNLTSEYGELLAVKALNNNLYVFCETGVSIILIGETLAQQSSGGVFVNSENFVGDSWWLQENFKDIKENSIVRIDNAIMFCDGYDVYRLAGRQLENITEGTIPLDPDNDYTAIVDDTNDEYILSDLTNGFSWVYNYLTNVWYGPNTFSINKGTNYRNQVISTNGGDLVELNTGNDFNGTRFNVLIESVANDTEQSFYDKTYRKFYLNTEDNGSTIFSYGKDPNNLVSKNVGNMINKNGYKHQGVKGTEQNTKTIFWEIDSLDLDFELKDIAWRMKAKDRR